MTLTTTALFLLVAAGLALWMWKDTSFRKREFIAVSFFWVFFVATPWGADGVGMVQDLLRTIFQTAGDTVNNVAR